MLLNRIGAWLARQDVELVALARGASLVGVLKLLAAVFGFALNVVLGRTLGANATGAYFLTFTVVTIAATVGRMGLDSTVIRYVAGHATRDDWPGVIGVQRTATKISLICSSLIAVILAVSADFIATTIFSDPGLANSLRFMAAALVPLSQSVLYSRLLQGLSETRDFVLVLSIIPSGLALVGTWLLARTWEINGAIAAYVVAVSVAAAYGWSAWRRSLSKRGRIETVSPAERPTKALLESGAPLLVGALLQHVIQMAGTILLGVWADNSEVSQFALAWRTALLLTFALLAVNTISQPKFAELYSRGDKVALSAMANKSALLMTTCTLPVVLVFLLAPKFIMSAFGADFVDGSVALQILSIGQFVNVAAGSVGVLLVMSGHEREYRNVQIAAASVALLLNVALIPAFGATGAAIATAAALILQNVLFGYFVWTRLGILTIIPRRIVERTRQDKSSS